MDRWDRKTNFNCDSCMFFVPKEPTAEIKIENLLDSGRCRRNAPTLKGFPVVYGNSDWCGEHKIGSNPVRDGKKSDAEFLRGMGAATDKELKELITKPFEEIEKDLESKETKFCEECNRYWGGTYFAGCSVEVKICPDCVKKKPFLWVCKDCRNKWYTDNTGFGTDCPKCKEKKPVTKEDVRKVMDAPLDSPAFDQPVVLNGKRTLYLCEKCQLIGSAIICPQCGKKRGFLGNSEEKADDNRKKETITAVYPVDLEEKAKIKENIDGLLSKILVGDIKHRQQNTDYLKEIRELLEKL